MIFRIQALIALTLFLIPIHNGAVAGELIFKYHGKEIERLSLEGLKKLVRPESVTVLDPNDSIKRTYIGFPFKPLLTEVYATRWEKVDGVLFSCLDGYQPSVRVSELERYDSYLAFRRPGGEEFSLINKSENNESVHLGPYYLIWDNIKHPGVLKEGAIIWPYQVTTIDLINFSDRFPNMVPPKSSSKGVINGFIAFRTYCMACHAINGEGGKKGIELNYPVNITEYFEGSWLKKWINNPRDISYNSTMPALDPNANDRDVTMDNIISYLRVMKDNKHQPKAR
ncbi:cytochrome c [Desulfobacterota bacterium AH_259_B03_O07]|nr:cytochrome c [Desulfobacterota bacterium AH_259_B03_O07]